jgi:glutaryl-CoA dehydrogenase
MVVARQAMSITPEAILQATEPVDFININPLLSEEERAIRDRVRAFVDQRVIPVAAEYWDKAQFPFELVPGLGELGIMGGAFKGYGCAGWSSVAYGLAIQELARGSGSLATFLHVQSGLAMTAIYELGSEEQKQRWLPQMARCEKIGCFGLTEPEVGSNAGLMRTTATRRGDTYVLNGEKKWIGNASFADVAVIWARMEDGRISGFLVEGGTPGYHAEVIQHKGSQRSVWQAHIVLDNCEVPAENRLPGARGLGSTLSILMHSRYGVAWDGLGHALACYEMALAYAKERIQFTRPIVSYQLVQQKLVKMITEISLAQLLAIHMGRLKDAGQTNPPMLSLFKMNNVAKAREIAALARDLMGGNGILLDYRVIEHMADIEGVYTYEGTNDINMLIVGQAITGVKAFAVVSPPPEPEKVLASAVGGLIKEGE